MYEQQLKYMIAIAESGQLQLAAQELYMTTASLRAALNRIEKELDTCLFQRHGERLIPTVQGEILLRYGRRLLAATEQLNQDLAQEQLRQTNTVRLSFCNSTYVEGWLIPFLLEHPQMILQQHPLEQAALYTALHNEEIDLAFDRWDKDIAGLSAQLLLEDTYLAAVPPDHPLSNHSSVTLAQLSHMPILCLPPSSFTTRITENLFRQAGLTPNIVYEGGRAILNQLFSEKKGIFFTSQQMNYLQGHYSFSTKQHDCHPVFLPISDPGSTFSLALFWKTNRQLPALVQQLQQHILKQYPVWSGRKEADRL